MKEKLIDILKQDLLEQKEVFEEKKKDIDKLETFINLLKIVNFFENNFEKNSHLEIGLNYANRYEKNNFSHVVGYDKRNERQVLFNDKLEQYFDVFIGNYLVLKIDDFYNKSIFIKNNEQGHHEFFNTLKPGLSKEIENFLILKESGIRYVHEKEVEQPSIRDIVLNDDESRKKLKI